jgi:hypothetical protein
MSRHKGSKNKVCIQRQPQEVQLSVENHEKAPPEGSEQDKTMSTYEASLHFGVSEATIRIWIDHGHLTKYNGRISTLSIRQCKFNTRRFV